MHGIEKKMTTEQRKLLPKFSGVVSSKSGDKTVKVVMGYLTKHPKYNKILKRRTVAHVHDENNQAKVGDRVEICKCRPMSKTKTWRLVRIMSSDE